MKNISARVWMNMDEEEAKEKAHENTLWLVKRIFFDY